MSALVSVTKLLTEAVTDKRRLDTLDSYAVLDTPPEEGFDDIVQLAMLVCEAPVALVSFVSNDRQWFKARQGFPHSQTALDSSICAHALGEPDLLIIPDLITDTRTRTNPLVTGDPCLRFYAGAPLRTLGGQTLGGLCVIDKKARPGGLTPRQAASLRSLSRQVMALLELRRALIERDDLIARRRKAEAQQRLLNEELSHRMKNMLAMIQAIAGQTLKRVTEQEAIAEFTQRLRALSTAHDVLLQESWAAAPLRKVVENVLGASSELARFEICGPDVTIGSRATLSLSLLLHELATNAAKYGALSCQAGRVTVKWVIDAGMTELMFSWRETGGPPVVEPVRTGFGSRPIRSGLIGTGETKLHYAAGGVEVEMRASMEQVRVS